MFLSVPSTLLVLFFYSRNVNSRPESFAAQRRYLNTSAPVVQPIALPTTFLDPDDAISTPAEIFPSATTTTTPPGRPLDVSPTLSTTFTQGFIAATTEREDPRPTDDGLVKTDEGDTKTEGNVKTDEGDTKTDEGDTKTDDGDTKTDEGDTKTDDVKVDPTTIYITNQPYATSRIPYGNYTYTLNGTTTQTTSCTTRKPGEASTVYIILPNPTTITITIGGNQTISPPPQLPEFTPPVFCPTPLPGTTTRYTPSIVPPTYSTATVEPPETETFSTIITEVATQITETTSRKGTGGGAPETGAPGGGGEGPPGPPTSRPVGSGSPITTVITTSKNPVVTYTTALPPPFPSNDGGVKVTALPTPLPENDGIAQGGGVNANQPDNLPQGGPQNNTPENSPSNNPPQNNPSQNPPVSGVGTGGQGVPDFGSGGQKPIVTSVRGVEVEIDPTQAVVGGTTVRFINPSQAAAVANNNGGANINGGGSGNVGGGSGAINGNGGAPANNIALPTNIVIIDGGIFSAVGSSIAVFDGRTIIYNNGAMTTTDYHHEQITLGASITYDGTTMGGADNTGTKLGIAGGISVTQIGESLAVISSTSLIVGPGAVVTTVIIDQYTVIANTAGLEIDGTTLSHPFQPYTQYITVGDVTMTQIGSSLLVLEGTTYTIGGSASSVINRQSITIASSSAISTITSDRSTTQLEPSAVVSGPAAATSSKSEGRALRPAYAILGGGLGMLYSFCV